MSNAKAIHNNTGSFCHKCSEPLNVHQSNLALLVSILCKFYYFMLSVADCFVHESVLQFILGQHREVSFVVLWCKMIRLVERMNDLKQITDCILFPLIVDLLDATQEHKSTE